MRILLAALAMLALVSCREQAETPDTGLAGYDPHLIENKQADCIRDGGRFGRGGIAGTFVCYMPTSDANQSCSKATDCEGLCLARSGTCAPVTPFFGCNEVFTQSGARATICVD